jgi:O-antigen ligase
MTVAVYEAPTRPAPAPAPVTPVPRVVTQLRLLTYALVCLFVFTIPWQGVLSLPAVGTIARLIGAVAALVGVATLIVGGRRYPVGDVAALTLVFAGWVTASIFWSIYPNLAMARIQTMAQLAAMVYLMWEFGHGDRRRRGFMAAWVAGSFVVGGAALLRYATDVEAVRYSASGTNPNGLAFILCLAVPMAWYLSLRTWSLVARIVYRAFLPFAIVATLLTASRSALVVMAVSLLIVPLTAKWATHATRLISSFAVLVALVIGTSFLPSAPLERLSTFFSGIDSGANGRFEIWRLGLNMFADHPIFGVGTGAARAIIQKSYFREAGMHNTYLSVAAELGLVGLVIFLLLLLMAIRGAVRRGGLDGRFGLVLGLTLLVGIAPLHLDYAKATWAVLAVLALVGVPTPRSDVAAEKPGPVLRRGTWRSRGQAFGR